MMNKKRIRYLSSLLAVLAVCMISMPNAHAIDLKPEEILEVASTAMPQIVVIVVAIVAAVVIAILTKKQKNTAKKKLIRGQTVLGMILAIVVALNSVCLGPMSNILTLVSSSAEMSISAEASEEGRALAEEIANEGIVLLKNEGILPLTSSEKKLNVFGWASINPCYAGTGSGGVNVADVVSLLEGIKNGGFTLNTELSDFYTAYRADRSNVGMFNQDWTLSEPPASTYSTELLENAKNFSDTALIVITRVGGENADLPKDAKWSEERQAEILQTQLTELLDNTRISGTYVWQFSDTRVCEELAIRRPRTMNNKGLVDLHRRPKMSYQTVKSIYSNVAI